MTKMNSQQTGSNLVGMTKTVRIPIANPNKDS
jgi:hypothetical protein